MNISNQASSSHRQRSGSSNTPKLHRPENSNMHKSYFMTSGSWSSAAGASPQQLDTHYQLRQTAVASPPNTASMSSSTSEQHKDKGKQSAKINTTSSPPNNFSAIFQTSHSPLGPNMLSSSSYKSVNLNSHVSDRGSNEPARLITYTKHSQGFTWNDELFLPSYLVSRHRYGGGYRSNNRRRRTFDEDDFMGDEDDMADFDEQGDKCPVTDIFVTDEEAAAMMP